MMFIIIDKVIKEGYNNIEDKQRGGIEMLTMDVLEKVFSFYGMSAFMNMRYVNMILKEAGMVINLDKSDKTHKTWVDAKGNELMVSVVGDEIIIRH